MRITTKGRYALRAMANLALSGTERPKPIKTIAAEEDISPEFLEQIFFKLRKSGIINSVRGPGGGFLLDRDPATVTTKEIFEAVGEGLEITPCSQPREDGTYECDKTDDCVVHDVWREASDFITGYFENLTLAKVLENQKDSGYEPVLSGSEFGVAAGRD